MPGVPLHGALGIHKHHWKRDVMERMSFPELKDRATGSWRLWGRGDR